MERALQKYLDQDNTPNARGVEEDGTSDTAVDDTGTEVLLDSAIVVFVILDLYTLSMLG